VVSGSVFFVHSAYVFGCFVIIVFPLIGRFVLDRCVVVSVLRNVVFRFFIRVDFSMRWLVNRTAQIFPPHVIFEALFPK